MTPLASLLVNVVTLLKGPEPVSFKDPTTNRKRQFCDATSTRVGEKAWTTFDLLYFAVFYHLCVHSGCNHSLLYSSILLKYNVICNFLGQIFIVLTSEL